MKPNERLYKDTKIRILQLKKKGFLSDLQVAYLLNNARKKLGLRYEEISIYL